MRQLCNVAYAVSVENLDQKGRLTYDAALVAPVNPLPAATGRRGAAAVEVPVGVSDVIRAMRLPSSGARR